QSTLGAAQAIPDVCDLRDPREAAVKVLVGGGPPSTPAPVAPGPVVVKTDLTAAPGGGSDLLSIEPEPPSLLGGHGGEILRGLAANQAVEISPTVEDSPLVAEALAEPPGMASVQLSESIGPMQSGVLPTMLAILGIKPFDTSGELFQRYTDLVPRLDPGQLGG